MPPITITRNISGATSTSFLILHGYGYDGSVEHWHNRLGAPSLDPYSPAGVPPWVGTGGCEIDEIEGAGHLNPDDGYGRWASCERWCLDPRERIA